MLTAFILYIWNVICTFCLVVETNIYTSTDKKCECFVPKRHTSVAVSFNQYSCKLKEKIAWKFTHTWYEVMLWKVLSSVPSTAKSLRSCFEFHSLVYFRFGFVRIFFVVASAAVLYHCNIIWDMTVNDGSCSVWMYCLKIHMKGLRETIWKVISCSVTELLFFFTNYFHNCDFYVLLLWWSIKHW
jgi:hypothetical protein